MAIKVYSEFTEALGDTNSTSNIRLSSEFTEVLGDISVTANIRVYSEFIEMLYDPNPPTIFTSSMGLLRNEF
jgi:hypothetical protein